MQRASAVLNVPLAIVEEHLRPVTSWTAFLPGLEAAEATSFARYRFRVREDGRTADLPVAVRMDRRRHRVSWQCLHGPAYEGRIILEPVGDRRTRVDVEVRMEPLTVAGQFAGMVGSRRDLARTVVQRLADACTAKVTAAPDRAPDRTPAEL